MWRVKVKIEAEMTVKNMFCCTLFSGSVVTVETVNNYCVIEDENTIVVHQFKSAFQTFPAVTLC